MRQFLLALIALVMPVAISAQTACGKVCCDNSQNVKTAKAGVCPVTGKSCTMGGSECKADCAACGKPCKDCPNKGKDCPKDCKECKKDCANCPNGKKDCPKNRKECKNSCVRK